MRESRFMFYKENVFEQGSKIQSRESDDFEVQKSFEGKKRGIPGWSKKANSTPASSLARFLPPIIFTASILVPQSLLALGLGGVDTKSYIGQPLLVEIPLYNVEAPNDLKIELERVDGELSRGLSASLGRANSQLSIIIRSDSVVNEPYFNFALNIDDQGNEFRKELTVLLDLLPTSSASDPRPIVPQSVTQNAATFSQLAPTTTSSNSVMGPYDWAKAGAIPERFGAVLDGQSLWRVARRISPAMSVSNNQMMWALYNANPSAFATTKIESLRAGVYLDIPDEALVKSIGDSQAKQYLDQLSSGLAVAAKVEQAQPASADQVTNTNQKAETKKELNTGVNQADQTEEAASDSDQKVASTERFQLTGLDERVSSDGALTGPQDNGSQEIINSLAQAVSSMTEQLSLKDKQISALQDQVTELKTFIQNDQMLSDDVLQLESALAAIPESSPSQDVKAVEPLSEKGQPRLFVENFNLLPWLLLGILLTVLILMRDRFVQFWKTIRYSGRDDEVGFDPSELNHDPYISDSMETEIRDTIRERLNYTESKNDSSVERAMTRQLASEEKEPDFIAAEDTSFHMSESEFSNSEFSLAEYGEIVVEEEAVPPYLPADDSEAVSFQERFAQLIAQGDSELASQLLELARGNQVSASRYHFYKLQLLSLNKNEDPFYDYYSEIEAELATFPQDVQTDISKLVVKMSQRDYEFG